MADTKQLRGLALESRDAVELLSDKWRISVLHLLQHGPLRSSEVHAGLPNISAKVLTQTLRSMERDGLLVRRTGGTNGRRVEYALSEMGGSVIAPLRNLCHWAKLHIRDRDRSRKDYDAKNR